MYKLIFNKNDLGRGWESRGVEEVGGEGGGEDEGRKNTKRKRSITIFERY